MKAWERDLLSELEKKKALPGSMQRLLSRSPGAEELSELPFEADAEQLRWWLLENLDASPLPDSAEQIWFRLTTSEWLGRVDSCDLELLAGEESDSFHAPLQSVTWTPENSVLGSLVLPRIARLISSPEDPHWNLCVVFASLAVRSALHGVDEALFLRGLDARGVTVGFESGPGIDLGYFDGQSWDTSQRCTYSRSD